MAVDVELMANESIILQEVCVAHGGVMAPYTDELILTNLRLIFINRGLFGNKKGVYNYSLDQIKIVDGRPQVLQGKLSNGTLSLDIHLLKGVESFNFQSGNNKKIDDWITAISKALGYSSPNIDNNSGKNTNGDTFADGMKELGEGFTEMGQELFGLFGVNVDRNKDNKSTEVEEKIIKKCAACGAPLMGTKGQIVKCKYCDTDTIIDYEYGVSRVGGMKHEIDPQKKDQSNPQQSQRTTPPPVPQAVLYNVVINGQSAGPFTIDNLKQMASDGQLKKDTLVWKKGMSNWENAANIEELSYLFTQTAASQKEKLWTSEPAEFTMRPNIKPVNKGNPVRHILNEYKVKCEWCWHVFSYYESNLGFRAWYPHGFVYCPFCKKPLRHHPDYLCRKVPFVLYPNGTIVEEKSK